MMIATSAKKARPFSNSLIGLILPRAPVAAAGTVLALVSVMLVPLVPRSRGLRLARGGHDVSLGYVGAALSRDTSTPHDDDTVRDRQAFIEFRGRIDHGLPRNGPR